jgi:Family of unknown function (DUF5308)
MTALPASHPRLAHHLSDPALTPLLSSATPSTSQFAALGAFTTASIAAYESAKKLGLGLPQRIIIETSRDGPLVLHSCLTPPSSKLQGAGAELEGAEAGTMAGIAGDVVGITREALRLVSGPNEDSERLGQGHAERGVGLRLNINAEGAGASIDEGQHIRGEVAGVNGQGLLPDWPDKGKEPVEGIRLGVKADEVQLAPLLIATVVAPSHELAGEARRTVVRLERIGVEFQKTWVREKEVERSGVKDNEEADD